MTTKPKAKKFRIRRSPTAAASAADANTGSAPRPDQAAPTTPRQLNPMEELAAAGHEDGFPAEGFATAGRGPAVSKIRRIPSMMWVSCSVSVRIAINVAAGATPR